MLPSALNPGQPLMILLKSTLFQIFIIVFFKIRHAADYVLTIPFLGIHLLDYIYLWFSMVWPFCSKLYLMETFKLLLRLSISWFSLLFPELNSQEVLFFPYHLFSLSHILGCWTAYGMGQKPTCILITWEMVSGGHKLYAGFTFSMDYGNDGNCDQYI